jgi:glycosyltransferase involved in cell wall biosynthesis
VKVLIDARELAGRTTGVGRYLNELLQRWTAPDAARPHDFVLCAPALPEAARPRGLRTIETGGSSGTVWEQWTLARVVSYERPDVLFCPAYTAPLAVRAPVVVTIHDISFVAHPEWFTFREGARRRLLTRAAARKATSVITVSEFSAAEIAQAFGVPGPRIHVIRHGVPVRRASAPVKAREPLVLFVGSIFNRRHLPELMKAMRRVMPHVRGSRLAIVGENRTQPREDLHALAERLGIADAVEITDYVSEARLAELYAQAKVFAFVSDYEGFGLTPLEALAAGVPPVVADTPVAHETCGRAASYVKPGNVDALAAALQTLLTDDRARVEIFEAAPAVLQRYSWVRAADATLQVLEQAARLPPAPNAERVP